MPTYEIQFLISRKNIALQQLNISQFKTAFQRFNACGDARTPCNGSSTDTATNAHLKKTTFTYEKNRFSLGKIIVLN